MSGRNVYDEKGWAMPEAAQCWWTSISELCFSSLLLFSFRFSPHFFPPFLLPLALTLLIFLSLPSYPFTCLPPAGKNVTCGELKWYFGVWYYSFDISLQEHAGLQRPTVFKTASKQVLSKSKYRSEKPLKSVLYSNKQSSYWSCRWNQKWGWSATGICLYFSSSSSVR